jgi:ribosome-associated protein
MTRDDELNRRQLAQRDKRKAGDRSGDLARTLMGVAEHVLDKLELEEDLRAVVDEARRITSHQARRRAERALAGQLRRFDLAEVNKRLANVQSAGVAEPQLFHAAERWRARLIEEGEAAAAEFPGGLADPLPKLIADARREKETGKPPGAARALFRHVIDVLRASR